MFLSSTQARVLSRLMMTLAEPHGEAESRERVGAQLLELLQADYYASYVWNPAHNVFDSRVALNISDDNLRTYEIYYQHHDPITSQMQRRRGPVLVEQVMPQAELVRTEFFNDFLWRDGLYWGVNLYAWDGAANNGDMRIWRSRRRERFGSETLDLLELIKPAFVAALRRAREQTCASGESAMPAPVRAGDLDDKAPVGIAMSGRRAFGQRADGSSAALSERELAVAQLASLGLADKVIAQRLGIAFTTVRTHLGHAFRKLGVDNRVQLASRVGRLT
jgi:DNA-binding CsgD family transcriptional regulator